MDFATAADVTSALVRVANAPNLLVVSDFDGTIADFSTDIYAVPVNETSISALRELNAMPHTTAAMLSGRHLEGLQRASNNPEGIIMAGSHGADAHELTPEEATALRSITEHLEMLIADVPGAFIEHKPFNAVLHYRDVAEDRRALLLDAVANLNVPGAHPIYGKGIVEYSVVNITKGTWITEARDRYAADAVIFLGDDVTDENGFRALGPADLGVRVGPGDTAAHIRIPDTAAVADLLSELVQLRGEATVSPTL